MSELIQFNANGIYCRIADCYIDPWRPVARAFITHAHSDHARWGMERYIAHRLTVPILRHRLGREISAHGIEYNEEIIINGVRISLHPAGHVPGSSQIRVEYKGEIWVISGDYKLEDDGLSTPFEPVKCHTFVTESTFGLPIFKWKAQSVLGEEINDWWRENRDTGKASVLFAYSLGKAQRIMKMIDPGIGFIFGHGAVESLTNILREAGLSFPTVKKVSEAQSRDEFRGSLIIAPPSAAGTPWMKRFLPYSTASASGWMAMRGVKRRRGIDMGFVVSDHADFDSLNSAVKATEAETVYVTHGYTSPYARWLTEQGIDGREVETEYKGESVQEEEELSEKPITKEAL